MDEGPLVCLSNLEDGSVCGHPIAPGTEVCDGCGGRVPVQKPAVLSSRCQHELEDRLCGTELHVGSKYCPQCGNKRHAGIWMDGMREIAFT